MTKRSRKASDVLNSSQKVAPSESPPFMKGDEGLGKEWIGPEDIYPVDIVDDVDNIIRDHGFDPHDPLEMLLTSTISAHPLELAWRYHVAQTSGEKISLTALIKECYRHILPDSKALERSDGAENWVVRRIREKWKREKNLLLARVAVEMHYDRMDTIEHVRHVAKQVAGLGIALDLSAIRPVMRLARKTHHG